MIGGLMYLTASHPDITLATFVCARYQARPTVKHLKEDSGFELIAYSDADHTGCKDDCKSTSGGLQFLGGKLVSWSSKKQDCTAMSTAEAEYIPMYCDSKSAIAISCNPVQHSKTKHIDIRYHFIKEHVEKGTMEIYFVRTEYQLADLFTKALPKERFEYLVHRIGYISRLILLKLNRILMDSYGMDWTSGQQRIISWRYYESCRVHCLNLESMDIYTLIERTYPLSAEMCKVMLDKKLQGGKLDENCYKMLKMMEKQAGIRK
ncbi:hypothetical protein Tco_0358826 [Tanacetum coccineum]